ncbi:peptidylprolyl isomerase [Paraburkholderia sp. IMGN_8]|uniref:peptidylprolyl isomerase n=1 Tax=Paraburkholderia sp. IMGN_8 TaxID=3136564 RepID=UPI0031014EDB
MKCVIRFSTALLSAFVASVCPFAATAAGVASAPAADAIQPPHSAVVASVNGRYITQSDLDNAVAESRERDTVVLRRTLKHRLIALELLRQAAGKRHYATTGLIAQHTPQAVQTIAAIRLYVRDAVRPEPVTDADVRARYWRIVSSLPAMTQGPAIPAPAAGPAATDMPHPITASVTGFFADGVPVTSVTVGGGNGLFALDAITSVQIPSFGALQDSIRQQLETERLNEAIRAVVENLMEQARINE